MLNELFRAYKKLIIAIVMLGCAVFVWFFGCRRQQTVDTDVSIWEEQNFEHGGYGYHFESGDLSGDLVFGIKGYTVMDANIPVTVTLNSGDKDFNGLLKISLPGNSSGGIAYQSAIQCEKNAATSLNLTIPQLGNASYFCFQILDQYQNIILSRNIIPLYSEWMDEDETSDGQICIGLLSDQADNLSFLDGTVIDNGESRVKLRFISIDEKSFPDNEDSVEMLTAIMIDDFTISSFSEQQKNVLFSWMRDGGHLIIATGEHGKKNLKALQNELHVTSGEVETGRLYFGDKTDFSGEISLYLDQLHFAENAGWKRVSWSEPASFFENSYGKGEVQILRFSFTDESILQWNRLDDMTSSLFAHLLDSSFENTSDQENGLWCMEMALADFFSSQMPNAFYYGVFFIFYLCTLTFIAYFTLRRMKKREYIWFVVPALSLFFTFCLLIRSKGNSTVSSGAMSAIRIVDEQSEKNDIYFLYQNADGESMELDLIPSIDSVVPMDFEYAHDAKVYSELAPIQEEYTISDTLKGFDINFSEATPGTMRMIKMSENKSMNYGEKTQVLTGNIQADHTSFSGSITNVSDKNFDRILAIRGNQYWSAQKLDAGQSLTISKGDVSCWSPDEEEYTFSLENDDSVTEDILNYLLYRYMKNNKESDELILIGINLNDSFSLLQSGSNLKNQVSVYANYVNISPVEQADYHPNINQEFLADRLTLSDLTMKVSEQTETEVEYQFDENKSVHVMTRNRDSYQGRILAYNYETKKKEEILSEADEVMRSEDITPYLSENNEMKITYEQAKDAQEYNLPVISVWIKNKMKEN